MKPCKFIFEARLTDPAPANPTADSDVSSSVNLIDGLKRSLARFSHKRYPNAKKILSRPRACSQFNFKIPLLDPFYFFPFGNGNQSFLQAARFFTNPGIESSRYFFKHKFSTVIFFRSLNIE